MNTIAWIENRFKDAGRMERAAADYDVDEMKKAVSFHSSMPQYDETPFIELKNLSEMLGIAKIYLKDESKRFGLNAFKGLGVSYAMAKYFAGELDVDLKDFTFEKLLEKVSDLPAATFSTATDGNHGIGVAWAAEIFKQNSKVYMPKGTAKSRLDAVLKYGAEGTITDLNYDETVEFVRELSQENGWIHLQDTAWEGYTEFPMYIMQGYTTIIEEIERQLKNSSLGEVSHVILQAGVGSFAGAMAAALYNLTNGKPPRIIVVEPGKANCLYQSAGSEEGMPVRVHGELDSMMAGLSCGEPSPVGWEILKSITDCFVSCDDAISAKGMRVLGSPAGGDEKVVSGESGSVPLGFLYEVMTNEEYDGLKEQLGLDAASEVLMINTEGDTDPENYRKVTGDGSGESE
ncbi:diaminopropionate ammonia-lyase [Salinicoccus halodurans]|uniref:Diaminopropionate ammonia-lyase n=1 Tax=Salinicoccus halodurans TaxID=407035 RepID=A0A0F7HJ91_9STAP|nr:diaminopropionate ammonia-lyase [Salinicoccus halodurans]AKG73123.1 diaminopropionate ammonia-lyase [Salinicoccus halodurans]SFK85195.1 diaminopropionate ammonia-lyase [Salinicoccus halodurans]